MSGFFSNENQFQNDPNVSQRDKLTGFYGNAVRPAYIEDLVAKAEQAAATSMQYRDETEVLRDNTQAIYDNTVGVYNTAVTDTTNIYNNTVGVYDATVVIKDDTQAIKDATTVIKNDTQTIYNNTVGIYNNTVTIKDETLGYRNETEIFRDEAEAAAIATANGVVNKGHWDASTGNFPTPTINPVEKADWYRISTGGTMTDANPAQVDITVNAGDNLYWDTFNDVWYAIENDNASWQKFTRGEAELNQMRGQKKNQFAASGFVNFGKHRTDVENINEGMFVNLATPNLLQWGRTGSNSTGSSLTNFAVTSIAGIVSELLGVSGDGINVGCNIKFPEAPDGTVTFNNVTGAIVTHVDAATAFAFADANTDTEVVIERMDMFGAEYFLEEVSQSNPYVYPKGMIQSQATTMNGIATGSSNRPTTYYAVYDGDTGSRGLGVNFYALTHSQKKAVVSDETNNIFMLNDGRLVQWRMRQRTIAGAGNGDWQTLPINATPTATLAFKSSIAWVNPQGQNDDVGTSLVNTANLRSGGFSMYKNILIDKGGLGHAVVTASDSDSTAVNGECYFQVWGVVPRLNQGAYHPSFNPMGAGQWNSIIGYGRAWYDSTVNEPTNTSQAFHESSSNSEIGRPRYQRNFDGVIGGSSGRPDGRFYDAVYASGQGGVIDYRTSAWDMGSKEEASKVFQKVVNGSYRGEETLSWTKVTVQQLASGTNSVIRIPYEKYPVKFGTKVYQVVGTTIITATVISLNGSSGDGLSGDYQLDKSISRVQNANIIVEFDTGSSVSGDFTQTDVIGDPANILATPQLANGWLGGWIPIIPNGSGINYPLTRKNTGSTSISRQYTANNGSSWTSDNPIVSATTNTMLSSLNASTIQILTYIAFAKQTKQSVNKPVLNSYSGLGEVYSTSEHNQILSESLIGKVCTNTNLRGASVSSIDECTLSSAAGALIVSSAWYPQHSPINVRSPNNDSPAVKTLWYQTSDNQQVGLNFAYNELVYNSGGTVGNEWGDTTAATTYSNAFGQILIVDGQSTYTNLNGDTCLYGTNELAIPYGYTKNKARAGEQSAGVDL